MNHLKFIGCAAGIIVCYGIFGIVQEAITKGKYGEGEERQSFHFSQELVFVQCLVNALFAYLAIFLTKPAVDDTPMKYYALSSLSYVVAMISTNQALQYISYPFQVLAKSCKPIPIMLFGVLFAHKRYSLAKYLYVFLIVFGVAMFLYKDTGKNNNSAKSHYDFGMGELLLLLSLSMDGTTGAIQDRMRAKCRVEWHHMMFQMNAWSSLYLTASIFFTGDLLAFVTFIRTFPYVLGYMAAFAVCSAIGQFFVFVTVSEFGPLTCSIITTVRKVVTIVVSVALFGNFLTLKQALGAATVFLGLFLDTFYGKKKVK